MRHLFGCWDQVAAQLREAEAIALFLDFDGTLAPFRAQPEAVRLDPATRRLLLRLARRPRLRIWVISGRRRADVRGRIQVPGLRYLGLHGWEDHRNGKLSAEARALLAQARTGLGARVKQTAGIWIEDKEAALALHYRGAPQASIAVGRSALREVLEPLNTGLHLMEGNQVWEVIPRELGGKGTAARRAWYAFRRNALPVYLGDDANDESAFAALSTGITVRVGPKCASKARFRLQSPPEVRRFLRRMEAEVR